MIAALRIGAGIDYLDRLGPLLTKQRIERMGERVPNGGAARLAKVVRAVTAGEPLDRSRLEELAQIAQQAGAAQDLAPEYRRWSSLKAIELWLRAGTMPGAAERATDVSFRVDSALTGARRVISTSDTEDWLRLAGLGARAAEARLGMPGAEASWVGLVAEADRAPGVAARLRCAVRVLAIQQLAGRPGLSSDGRQRVKAWRAEASVLATGRPDFPAEWSSVLAEPR